MTLHVAIIAPDPGGHHLALHVRAIAAEAVRRGWRLTLLTTEAATRHPACDTVRCETHGALVTAALLPPCTVTRREPRLARALVAEARRWRAFRAATSALTRDHIDAVYVTSLEQVARSIALAGSPFGSIPFSGMYTKARFHHRRMHVRSRIGPRARLIETTLMPRLLAVPTLRAVPVVDEPLVDWAGAQRNPAWRKVVLVRDGSGLRECVARRVARAELGIDPAQVVVLLYGALAPRKGVAELAAALADARTSRELAVLVAGDPDETTRGILRGPAATRLRERRRYYEDLGFLDDRREARAFAAADIVWLGYRNFDAMSGVMVQAANAGLPCLATDRGLVGWNVARHGLGAIVDTGRHDDVVDALARLACDEPLRRAYGERGRAFACGRTAEAFGGSICDAIAYGAPAP